MTGIRLNGDAWTVLVILVFLAVLLVIVPLARAVGRLAKAAGAAAVPAPAPKPSGGGAKPLLILVAAVGGLVLWDRHKTAAAPAKATPAPPLPSPPAPRPTVTQTVAPHISMPAHFPLTGGQIVIAVAILAVAGFVIVRTVVRNLP